MTGWTSLSGYLMHRPSGALGRLKSRRRRWFVFDEIRCELLMFNSDNEARSRAPQAIIDIKKAAITISTENPNEFTIFSDKKDYTLLADTHESMMIWVRTLQAKRDTYHRQSQGFVYHPEDLATKQRDLQRRRQSMPSNQEVQSIIQRAMRAKDDVGKVPVIGEAMDEHQDHSAFLRANFLDDMKPSMSEGCNSDNTTSETLESEWSRGAHETNCDGHDEDAFCERRIQDSMFSNGDDRDSQSSVRQETRAGTTGDDTNKRNRTGSNPQERPANILRRMNSDSSTTGSSLLGKHERSWSLSSQSASCDSAIGHGECPHALRLHDVEAELMATKCELARVLNRLATCKRENEEQQALVHELQVQYQQFKADHGDPRSKTTSDRKVGEKCRFLQNQNRFLNDEVLKLSCLLQQYQYECEAERIRRMELEAGMERLKQDYSSLFQSAIRITWKEDSEEIQTDLQDSARPHVSRVLELLEEARKVNPALPTYESSYHHVHHVDSLGFKHTFEDEGLALHYVCRQLCHHYSKQLGAYQEHLEEWKRFLKTTNPAESRNPKKLKSLVRKGIPCNLRGRVWRALVRSRISKIVEEKGPNYYSTLCNMAPESQIVAQHRRQIALDLLRTMPSNVHFSEHNSEGTLKLQEVLQAFCLHNPSIGYCQGMNFLVGLFLLFMEPEDAFWCLVAVTEKYFSPNYFDHCLAGAQADQAILEELLKEKLPRLHGHLAKHGIHLSTVTVNWFLAVFFDAVPFQTLLRMWDCFLLDGSKVLFRFALAILKLHEHAIVAKDNVVSILRQIKSAAALCHDVDALFKVAFEELKPFPRRQDIAAKEAYYYKTLREGKRHGDGRNRNHLDRCYGGEDDTKAFECAIACDQNRIWLCYGTQQGSRMLQVRCDEGTLIPLHIELDSRVTCLHKLRAEGVIVMGTLAHFVHAFAVDSTANNKPHLRWEARLHDSILSLCSTADDAKVFAGLTNGTLAVIQNVLDGDSRDVSYVMIGCSAITCLRFFAEDQQLWCACGNKVFLVSAKSLDVVDQFQASVTGFEYISELIPSDQGVWISIRGSCILQLWDRNTLTCKLMFDVKNNACPRQPIKTDDVFSDPSRITAILAVDDQVLAGTADGFLVVYRVIPQQRSPCEREAVCPIPLRHPNDQIGEKLQRLYEERSKSSGIIAENDASPTLARASKELSDSGFVTTSAASRRQSSITTLGSQNLSDVSEMHQMSRKDSSGHHSLDSAVQLEGDVLLEEPDSEVDCASGEGKHEAQIVNGATEHVAKADEESGGVTRKMDRYRKRTSLPDIAETGICCKMATSSNRATSADLRMDVPHFLSKRCRCAYSLDDIHQWLNGDNLSSFTSDSYEFDDLLVPYGDDADIMRHAYPFSRSFPGGVTFRRTAKPSAASFAPSRSSLTSDSACQHVRRPPPWPANGKMVDASFDTKTHIEITVAEVEGVEALPSPRGDASPSWGSLEDASSTTETELDSAGGLMSRNCGTLTAPKQSSDTASNISFSSEHAYALDLSLRQKVKISDKPVKCLLHIRDSSGESVVVSCSGCYGDEEAVLKWTRQATENLWSNKAIANVSLAPHSKLLLKRSLSTITLPSPGEAVGKAQPHSADATVNDRRRSRFRAMFSNDNRRRSRTLKA